MEGRIFETQAISGLLLLSSCGKQSFNCTFKLISTTILLHIYNYTAYSNARDVTPIVGILQSFQSPIV